MGTLDINGMVVLSMVAFLAGGALGGVSFWLAVVWLDHPDFRARRAAWWSRWPTLPLSAAPIAVRAEA